MDSVNLLCTIRRFMANSGKTVSFAPQPMIESTFRHGLNMDISIRQDVKIQSAIDSAIKVLIGKGLTEVDAHDIVISIKKPHDEKYKALEKEYLLIRDRCNFLEQQLNLGRDLAPEELVRTNTVAHMDDSYAGELALPPSYIGATTLPQSITNLNAGFQRELEALREENKALLLEKDSMNERLKELERDREQHLETDAHLQILAKKVEDYKALLLTKENYAAEIDILTQERNDLAAALEELQNNIIHASTRRDSPDYNLQNVTKGVGTDDPEITISQRLSELLQRNQELYEENQILAAELDRVYSESTDKCPDGLEEVKSESAPKKIQLKARLDVSSIALENVTLGLTEKPVNAASTLQATRSRKPQSYQPDSLTELTTDIGTASKFRETDFFEELATEEPHENNHQTEIQVIGENMRPLTMAVIARTSSAISPVSRALVDYEDSKSASPAYRQIESNAPKNYILPITSPVTEKHVASTMLGDPKIELSETQVAELAQQLAMLETEKIKAAREIEQIESAYKTLQCAHDDLKRQYDELVHKYTIQENRNTQLEEQHARMQELFNMKSPDRHISSIDVSLSSQQEKNAKPIHPLARIRESDLDVGDLTSSGHHITEAERFIEEPPSTSAQSFAELPDGDDKTGKVKTVLVWKEKCSQLESRINYVLKDVDILKQEKRDLEEELEEADKRCRELESINKELMDEIERLKQLLKETQAETLLFKTATNGIGKQLQELLINSTCPNTLSPRELVNSVTNTALLVEQAKDLIGTVHNDPPSKVFTEDDVTNMMTELRIELQMLRGEADNHQEAATVFADEIRSLQATIDSLRTELEARECEIAQKIEEGKHLSSRALELQDEISRLNEHIADLLRQTSVLSELQSSHTALLAELDSVTATNNSLTERVHQLTAQLDLVKANHATIAEQQIDIKKQVKPLVVEHCSTSVETERTTTNDVSLLVSIDTKSEHIPSLIDCNILTSKKIEPCQDCIINRKTIDQLTVKNEQNIAQISELQTQLLDMSTTRDMCDRLQKENQEYASSNQLLSLKLVEMEKAHKHTTELIAIYEDQMCRLEKEILSLKTPPSATSVGIITTQTLTLLKTEACTQSDRPLTFTQEVQVSIPSFASTPSEKGCDIEGLITSSTSLPIDGFLESMIKTNKVLGIEEEPDISTEIVKNSTAALARLIDQHTIRMEKRINEYNQLVNLQAKQNKENQQPLDPKHSFNIEKTQLEHANRPNRMGFSSDIITTLQHELQLISDHVRANNENISSVARTTELAFNKVREALTTHVSGESSKHASQAVRGSPTELLLYTDLLKALLDNIIRLNGRLDTMEQDRRGLVVDFAVCLGLSQSINEKDLKAYIKDLVTTKAAVDPGILIENIADLKKDVLKTDAQLHFLKENVQEQMRATSAPIVANALTIVDCDRNASSLPDVRTDGRALQLSNIDTRQIHESSSHHIDHTAPNTVEHLLPHSTSHCIRSTNGSIQHTLKSIVDVTNNCNDAKQKYLEERIEILEAENTNFKEHNASYVKKLAEQSEEIIRLQGINHQLSLKIAEQTSFQEQIQIAENTRKGITEQIRNVRSTLIEIKTCIQSDRSDGEENDVLPTKESKGIEAVEEKLIELTEDVCNWRLKYEKANAERKEMRARARTEKALRMKLEKAHKKLENNFIQLQVQLKEGSESLAWLKAATARYIEAVQQELDRINRLRLDKE